MKEFDLIIIGAGPAGITAGIYAQNFGLNYLMIGEEPGGLINTAYKVENYPGIFNISGKDLTKSFQGHQKHLKMTFKKGRVKRIEKAKKLFKIYSDKSNYQAKSIILAFGAEPKKIDIKNVDRLEGKGVGYHACGSSINLKDKVVAIIGGANAAVMSCTMIAEESKKVYLIYRQNKLRADKLWTDKISKLKNVEILYDTNVLEVRGKNKVEKIILDKKHKNSKELEINNLFIEAGIVPNTFLLKNLKIQTDKNGYIRTASDQATNVAGIFAAGDITTGSNSFRQIITACSEGAIATLNAFKYLSK